MPQQCTAVQAAPQRAAFFISSEARRLMEQVSGQPKKRRHFMARERREAAYNVEIEKAIDDVKRCRSDEWFRALLHKETLRSVGGHRRLTIADDVENGATPIPTDGDARGDALEPAARQTVRG